MGCRQGLMTQQLMHLLHEHPWQSYHGCKLLTFQEIQSAEGLGCDWKQHFGVVRLSSNSKASSQPKERLRFGDLQFSVCSLVLDHIFVDELSPLHARIGLIVE